ncbi:MAG: GyrI-like domain-containing protein [Anaerolineae bacterium]|nr:GyrI-like domain-containing protein [Anaerolineae bacterium]
MYALAYGIRAISKEAGTIYTVMPLEGLWWWEDMQAHAEVTSLTSRDKADFLWTMMILQPGHITAEMVEEARTTVRKKKNPPCLDAIRFETYHEGHAVQILHIGSYAEEAPTVQRLHDFIAEQGYKLTGKHHEIYLSNPDRVEPARLKTIIRQPMRKD